MKRLILLFGSIVSCLLSAEMRTVRMDAHPFADWEDWKPLGLNASYFSLTQTDGKVQLWFGASFQGRDSLVRLEGRDLQSLRRVHPQFDTRLVKDYDRDLDGIPHPILSRTTGQVLADGTEGVQGSIGPRYRGGGSELYPVLFVKSPKGEWTYQGPPSGDPEAFLKAARTAQATVRCEGGGLVQRPDGSLRLYSHGMLDPDTVPEAVRGGRVSSGKILVAESDGMKGPWTFRRDGEGRVVDITQGSGLPWLFPHVQSLGPHGYMLTGADQWPPKAVYAAYSRDGVTFTLPVDAEGRPVPLRRMTDVRETAKFCKSLRGVFNPDTGYFTATMNVSTPEDRGNSLLYSGGARLDVDQLNRLLGPQD